MTDIAVPVSFYEQFDADPDDEVPAENYGGWKRETIEISLERTAVVVMHAWDFGRPGQFPGWRRSVEYIPRAERICREVFPPLLEAVRGTDMHLFHVVSPGNYYKNYPGYNKAVALAGASPFPPDKVDSDKSLERLQAFRSSRVFVGAHNADDVRRGFESLKFPKEAEPVREEGIAENTHQLFSLCKAAGVNHLIYAGFAINWCLLLSPGGMAEMSARGFLCSAFREAVTAVENKETARTQQCKEIALWRVALAYGFVFEVGSFTDSLRGLR